MTFLVRLRKLVWLSSIYLIVSCGGRTELFSGSSAVSNSESENSSTTEMPSTTTTTTLSTPSPTTKVDTIAPTITAFSSSTANGSYKTGAAININATASETVQAGGMFTVTLDTGAVVNLTAAAQGTSFSGTYTVMAGQNTADLKVLTYNAGTVLDVAGNKMTSTALPAGANIADSKDIKVDTTKPPPASFCNFTNSPGVKDFLENEDDDDDDDDDDGMVDVDSADNDGWEEASEEDLVINPPISDFAMVQIYCKSHPNDRLDILKKKLTPSIKWSRNKNKVKCKNLDRWQSKNCKPEKLAKREYWLLNILPPKQKSGNSGQDK